MIQKNIVQGGIFLSEVKTVIDAKARLGEGPCYDHEHNLLYWVDIEGMCLHCYDLEKNQDSYVEFTERIGCAVLVSDGNLLLGLQKRLAIYDPKSKAVETILMIEDGHDVTRINDGKCDPYGNFWFGTMDMNTTDPIGSLYCLQSSGGTYRLTKMDGIHPTISNGLAWSEEGSEFFYIDTPTEQVMKYNVELGAQRLSEAKPVISFADQVGSPDGMTIDDEGMLWIAHWGGGRVTRWDPATGKCLNTLFLPATNVTSCAFVGINLDELYITTAREGLSEEHLINEPYAGGVFMVKTSVKGSKTTKFLLR